MSTFKPIRHYITPLHSVSVGDQVLLKDFETGQFEYGPYKVLQVYRLERENRPVRYFAEIAKHPWHQVGDGQIWDVWKVKPVEA